MAQSYISIMRRLVDIVLLLATDAVERSGSPRSQLALTKMERLVRELEDEAKPAESAVARARN